MPAHCMKADNFVIIACCALGTVMSVIIVVENRREFTCGFALPSCLVGLAFLDNSTVWEKIRNERL